MRYISTRGGTEPVNAAEAIKLGPAPGGGLFVPEELPRLDPAEIPAADYAALAGTVIKPFLPDFDGAAVDAFVRAAYCSGRFDHAAVAPLHRLHDSLFCLELWHGPTCAFKDMALQLLPYLMREATRLTESAELVILTAHRETRARPPWRLPDVPTRVIVFYPAEGQPHAGAADDRRRRTSMWWRCAAALTADRSEK